MLWRTKVNTCYTYFLIRGEFDPDVITKMLKLQPDSSWKIGTERKGGRGIYPCSAWSFGRCDQYDVITENQIKKTIVPLKDKIPILNLIRKKFDATFSIEVVPEIYPDHSTPSLGPDLEIIDFCHAVRAEIDIDLYVCPSKII